MRCYRWCQYTGSFHSKIYTFRRCAVVLDTYLKICEIRDNKFRNHLRDMDVFSCESVVNASWGNDWGTK